MQNLRVDEAGEPIKTLVGGPWDPDPKLDNSCLDPPPRRQRMLTNGGEGGNPSAGSATSQVTLPADGRALQELTQRRLAPLTLSFILQRSDSLKHKFDICQLPVMKGMLAGASLRDLVGRILEAAALANNGKPPISCAYDLAPAHNLLDRAWPQLTYVCILHPHASAAKQAAR